MPTSGALEVSTNIGTTTACSDEDRESNCSRLDGTTLAIFGDSPLQKVAMTKVSDCGRPAREIQVRQGVNDP